LADIFTSTGADKRLCNTLIVMKLVDVIVLIFALIGTGIIRSAAEIEGQRFLI
jgi:hypothetical protein